jgi:hypothetical protein
MTAIEFTAPTRRARSPFCYVIHRAGHWVGVCILGAYEVHTPKRFGARAAALADAKRIGATLAHHNAANAT